MGRRSFYDVKNSKGLYIQEMKFEDYDYDTGGAYWGNVEGRPMFCAFSESLTTMIFTRATNINEAKKEVKSLYKVTFKQ